MADYGVQTWGADGTPNNYGIKPVSVISSILLTNGQKSGSWSFTVPSGLKLNYYHVQNGNGDAGGLNSGRRKVVITGNTITVSSAGNAEYLANTFPAGRAFLIITLEA